MALASSHLFFCHNGAFSAEVVVAEEAVEPVVAVVGLWKDLVAGGARLAVPGPLPASEANHI